MGPTGKQELVFIFILVLLLFGPLALRSLGSPHSGEHIRGIGKERRLFETPLQSADWTRRLGKYVSGGSELNP